MHIIILKHSFSWYRDPVYKAQIILLKKFKNLFMHLFYVQENQYSLNML